ncbi:MAG TPA: ABC transporter permease [Vicinamibacterales bacterium]
MSNLLQDLRHAVRLLFKNPGFSLTAILVLALGIGANAAIFTIINTLMFRPLNGADRPGQMVGIYSHDHTRPDSYRGFSYPAYADIRDRSHSFNGVMAFTLSFVGIGEGDATRRTFAITATRNYFATLGVDLMAGRTFTEEEERPNSKAAVAIVNYQYWKSHGGELSMLGKTVRVNARPFTIVGIAPRGFTGTSVIVAPDVWLPIGANELVENDFMRDDSEGKTLGDRRSQALMVVGRLKPGLTPEGIAPSLEVLSAQLEQAYPAENKNQLLTSQKLPRLSISTGPQTDGDMPGSFAMLTGMAAIVLVVACLNLANMMLARGTARRKEIAMRLALGGSRGRIVRQLLTEGMMLSLLGGALGLLLGNWGVRLLVATVMPLSPVPLAFDATPDGRVMAATLAFCVFSTMVFGLGPAWKLSRTNVVPDLKEQIGEDSRKRLRWFSARNLLVTTQIALSLGLLTTAGLFTRGAMKAGQADPGYRYEGQVLASIDTSLAGYDEVQGRQVYRRLMDRMRGIPGVKSASFSSIVAFGGMTEGKTVQKAGTAPGYGKDGRPVGVPAVSYIVGSDYFATLGLKVLRGRDFTPAEEQDTAAPAVAIIDEPLARALFGHESPVGQQIQIPGRDEALPTQGNGIVVNDSKAERQLMEVVGVVPGLRHDLFDKAPVAHIYVSFGRQFRSGMNVHLRVASTAPTAEAAVLQAVRREIRAVDERLPVLGLQTMTHFRDTSLMYWSVKAGAWLFAVFGIVAVFLAVVGLYAVKAYVVARRTREIGIRMALGSTPKDVLWLVLKEGLALTAAGLVVGFWIAAGIGMLVGSLLYEVSAFDPVVFLAAPLLLATASLVACYLPALRATRIEPTVALRTE